MQLRDEGCHPRELIELEWNLNNNDTQHHNLRETEKEYVYSSCAGLQILTREKAAVQYETHKDHPFARLTLYSLTEHENSKVTAKDYFGEGTGWLGKLALSTRFNLKSC